jgi:hypothetical protein
MPKTISIDKIRHRKRSPEKNDRSGKDGAPPGSPFSYIILLDENDPTAANPPVKGIARHRQTKD